MKKGYNFDNNAKRIRLVYVRLERYMRYAGGIGLGETYSTSSVFEIPDGLDIEKACKIISYLSDKVENGSCFIEPCSFDSVAEVSHELKNYGFKKVEGLDPQGYHAHGEYKLFGTIEMGEPSAEIDGCVDLFTLNGDPRLFARTDLKKRYFNWYSKGVQENEVNELLNKKSRR